MKFEFTVYPNFNFVESFAKHFGLPVKDNTVSFPKNKGEGFIKLIELNPDLKCVIHHYRLKEDFLLKRLSPDEKNEMLSLVFYNQEIPVAKGQNKEEIIHFLKQHNSAIQIASSALSTQAFFPKNTEIHYIVIGIRRKALKSLLKIPNSNNELLNHIAHGNVLFYYFEELTEDIAFELKNLMLIERSKNLSLLSYQISIQKILFLLFRKLLERTSKSHYPINKEDADKVTEIRRTIVEDIGTPPRLETIAEQVGMSQTKMKRLFKQVYGSSIYQYYQTLRMQKASLLLKHNEYSVTEIDYQMGFTNMSHFSRVFKRYYSMT